MWKVEDSIDLYGVENWGNGYFSVNDKGNIIILPNKDRSRSVDAMDLIKEIEKSKDLEFPVLLRFPQMLEDRIDEITGSFLGAIEEFSYKGTYQPIFPMKVNQRKEVIEYIIKYGAKYKIGLEVGTKAELLAALSLGLPKDALLICNGYKDEDYLRLALSVHSVNNIVIVVDLFEEAHDILKYAEEMGITPRIGMRVKLFARGSGRWVESGGESAKFGLSTSEALELMKMLREKGLLDSLKMIHFHIGSQITDIRTIKNAMNEAARIYAKARKMAEIEYLHNVPLEATAVAVVFDASGIRRPSGDLARIERMFANANLVISAWHDGTLVGVCRALTDFSYCCYLSDLAVVKDYQHHGIGRELIAQIQAVIGEEVALILLASPEAMEYYPKVGFEKVENGFIIKRTR